MGSDRELPAASAAISASLGDVSAQAWRGERSERMDASARTGQATRGGGGAAPKRRAGLAGALTCYVTGCTSRSCHAASAQQDQLAGGGGALSRGGDLQALGGRCRLNAGEAMVDPVGAVLRFAAAQRTRACKPEDEVWFSTNHERYGYQTCLRIITLAEVDNPRVDLGAMGPVRRTPLAAEKGAADALLARLEAYIKWDVRTEPSI